MVCAVTTACALLVVSAAAAATPPRPWMRTAGTVSVSVDPATFAYSATLSAVADASSASGTSGASCGGFQGGGVSFRCEGVHYTTGAVVSPSDGHLSLAGPAQEGSGVDALGPYDSIGADFQGGSSAACALHTEIRYYGDTASFVFVADFSEDGVPGTNSTALLSPEPPAAGPVDLPGLSTAFPSWPAGSMGKECTYYSCTRTSGLTRAVRLPSAPSARHSASCGSCTGRCLLLTSCVCVLTGAFASMPI